MSKLFAKFDVKCSSCKEFDNDELENESKPFYPVQKPVKEEESDISSFGCRVLSYNNELFDLKSLRREKDYTISSKK